MNKLPFVVKVCGITRQSDLSTAMGMGAHYCGFIFHPESPRYIAPERVAALDSAFIRRVGVFVNQEAEEILDVMKTARLEFAQLQGKQTMECARRIGAEKVIRVLWPEAYETAEALQQEMERWADCCSRFLLDVGGRGGGHGRELDWRMLAELNAPRPWFLAGGLSPTNLNKALEQCMPDGIDLNSGVETMPGQKSPQKLLAAFRTLPPYTSYHIA